ncbi:MAG: hypothetical protein V4650_07125 [Pseudomonadota bacterium]
MNTHDLEDLSAADRAFALQARLGLRASESLNYVEAARLSAARAQAREVLMNKRGGSPAWAWFAVPVALAAVTVSVLRFSPFVAPESGLPAVGLQVQATIDVNATDTAALEWVSDEAGPDFYRDLEFYEWLQSQSPAKPNA